MIQGFFVTGTDTGVGKTVVACALIRLLRSRGVDAVGFKPMVSGEVGGRWEDVDALCEASGRVEPPEHVCPLRFRAPMAPVQAARLEGGAPDMSLCERALAALVERREMVVAEGIGGLLVPLDERTLVVDFIKRTGFHAVLATRAQLGTVNHTLLTLRELARADIPVAGVVMNVTAEGDASNAEPSIEEIERHAGRCIAALIPFCGKAGTHAPSVSDVVLKATAHLSAQLAAHTPFKDLVPPRYQKEERREFPS
jgi:dethiobiotin synthetase